MHPNEWKERKGLKLPWGFKKKFNSSLSEVKKLDLTSVWGDKASKIVGFISRIIINSMHQEN